MCTDPAPQAPTAPLAFQLETQDPGRKLSALSFSSPRHQITDNLLTRVHSIHTQSPRRTQNFRSIDIYCHYTEIPCGGEAQNWPRNIATTFTPHHNSPLNGSTKPLQKAREIPYPAALSSVLSWLWFSLSESSFPFSSTSESTTSGKERSFTLNTKCSFVLQHTDANTGKKSVSGT